MSPQQKTRDLARSLIACEADAATTSLHTEPATARVYESLRRQLGTPAGVDGFHASGSLNHKPEREPTLNPHLLTRPGR